MREGEECGLDSQKTFVVTRRQIPHYVTCLTSTRRTDRFELMKRKKVRKKESKTKESKTKESKTKIGYFVFWHGVVSSHASVHGTRI